MSEAGLCGKVIARRSSLLGETAMRSFAGALLLVALPASLIAGDWPAFRGPNGDGISSEPSAPLTWGPDQNVKWKFALPAPAPMSPPSGTYVAPL